MAKPEPRRTRTGAPVKSTAAGKGAAAVPTRSSRTTSTAGTAATRPRRAPRATIATDDDSTAHTQPLGPTQTRPAVSDGGTAMTHLTLSPNRVETLDSVGPQPDAARSRTRLRMLTDPSSPLLVYIGVLALFAGFALIFVAWAEVAGLASVDLQIPYLISAGFTGLALIMSGLVAVNVQVRRQDAVARERQMSALTEALCDLQRSLRP